MILSDLKRYLKERGQATLADMALHFRSDPQAVRGMLDVWIRKGKVVKHSASASCGDGCARCDPGALEVFSWIGEGGKTVPPLHPTCRP
jgi:hypothetical protein